MMGEPRVMQEALFYGFSLERHVPDKGYSCTNADQMKCKSKGAMQPKPCSCTNTMRRDFYLLKSCAGCGHD